MNILTMSRPFLGVLGNSAADDDISDRINYKYSSFILIIFGLVVTNRQFIHARQIHCWVPSYFTSNFESYTNLICWITNTYYVPSNKPLSANKTHMQEIKYYQWVPYILLLLAFCFYVPRLVWKSLSLRCGIDMNDVVEAAHEYKSVEKLEKSGKMMEYMIGYIDAYLSDSTQLMPYNGTQLKFMLKNHLILSYLFIKILYMINCFVQLSLISFLLGRDYYSYGLNILFDVLNGKGYADSVYFPRVTQCKFNVRELGVRNYSHEYNVQCVLPINLFNQQIFTFLWFWYSLLLIANTLSLCIWFYKFFPLNSFKYVVRRLNLLKGNVSSQVETIDFSNSIYPKAYDFHFKQVLFSPTDLYSIYLNVNNYRLFIYSYLRLDGVFILRMIACSSNDYVSTQVVHYLWKCFIDKYRHVDSFKLEKNICNLRQANFENKSGKYYA